MTIFSLGNACDLEHFSNTSKLGGSSLDNSDYGSPVVPMPTDPPFKNTNYQWNSDSSVAQNMTTNESQSFRASVSRGSQDFGSVNFGPDYWGENTENYSFSNKLLNNNLNNNQFQADSPDVIMPNMKPQSTYVPPARSHIVKNEDMNGRDKKMKMLKMLQQQQQKMAPKIEEPEYNFDKVEKDTKNLWIFIIAILIVTIGSVLYKSNYF